MTTKINGTNTAASPAITGADTDTGLSFASDTVNINTGGTTRATIDSAGALDVPSNFPIKVNGSEKLRIDSSGRVLIGTSTDNGFKFKVSDGGGYEFAFAPNDSGVNSLVNYDRSGSAYVPFMVSGSDLRFASGGNTERMRIDSDGTLCIGTTSDHNTGDVISVTGAAHIMEIQNSSTAGHRTITLRHSRASGGTDAEQIVFEESGGGAVGSIQSNGSSTSYNTSSDYRLKENVTAISDGITRLKTLKPSRFNFKADTKTTVDGFLAHEVTAVPEAITGTKDQVATEDDIAYEKGDPIYQSIDQSKLVPLLTAALQEAITKIETLETKVAALEAA